MPARAFRPKVWPPNMSTRTVLWRQKAAKDEKWLEIGSG